MSDFYDSKFTGAEIDNRLEAVPNKADKVQNATAGNLATLKEDGGIEDSGQKLSDFAKVTDLQNKADLGEDGKVPAEQVDAYSQSDSISAATRTALSLADTATPDAALAEIARQLSESGGLKLTQLWENASPTSSFAPQTITVDFTGYAYILIFFYIFAGSKSNGSPVVTKVGEKGLMNSAHPDMTANYGGRRGFSTTISTITFDDGLEARNGNGAKISNSMYVPYLIYGFNL